MCVIFAGNPPGIPGVGWKKKVTSSDQAPAPGGKMSVYCVNPGPSEQARHQDQLRRKVSRVESLRKLILGASNIDTRNVIEWQIIK